MPAREVHVPRMPAFDDRRTEKLRELDQQIHAAHRPSRIFGHDDRIRGVDERARELVDRVGRRGGGAHRRRARRSAAGHRGEQEFHRHRDEDRPLRRGHRQLTRALDRPGKQRGRVEPEAPLHAPLDEPGRPTDVREEPEPLLSRILSGLLAEADRFAGQHDHRNPFVHRAPERHGGVKRADGRVDHHRRQLTRGLRVAGRHPDGDFLVTRGHVCGNVLVGPVRLGEKFPDGRPLRAGRREDPLHAHPAQHPQQSFRAAQSLRIHTILPERPGLRTGRSKRSGALYSHERRRRIEARA